MKLGIIHLFNKPKIVSNSHFKQLGFTIVELLVVIVVISILAAIMIVSYSGIQERFKIASLLSDLDNVSKQLKLNEVSNSVFPATLSELNGGSGVKVGQDLTLEYIVNNAVSPANYCVSATDGTLIYNITGYTSANEGDCSRFGAVLDLDVSNTLSYANPSTNWLDIGLNGNNGVLMNGTGFDDINKSLVFDGVNDYVEFGNSNSLNPVNQFTIAARVYIDPAATTSYVVAKNTIGSGDLQYAMYWDSTSKFVGYINNSGAGSTAAVSAVAGNWYDVAMVWNKVNIKYYINGVQSGSTPSYTTPINPTNSTLNIGRRKPNNLYLKGKIAKFRLYDRALSAAEVGGLFNE